MQNFLSGMEYFDMAVVTADGFAVQTAYGSAWLYVACLSVVLSFLGNKAASAIVFQVFLQMAGLGLGYAVARRSAGRLPACVVLLYLTCSPGYLEMLKNLGPECLFFDLYLIVMLVVVGFLKAYCKNRCGRGAALAGAAGAGALIGMLGYLDLTAFTILALGAVVVTGKKSRTKEEPVRNGGGISAAVAALILTRLRPSAPAAAWDLWHSLRSGRRCMCGIRVPSGFGRFTLIHWICFFLVCWRCRPHFLYLNFSAATGSRITCFGSCCASRRLLHRWRYSGCSLLACFPCICGACWPVWACRTAYSAGRPD